MIVLNNEVYDISKAIMSKITRLYDGKAIPSIDINYICITSPCSNHPLISLFLYWNLLIQNVYTTDFKCVIIDPLLNSVNDNYSELLSKIKDSRIDNFMDKDIFEIIIPDLEHSKNIHNTNNIKKSLIYVLDPSIHDVETTIIKIKPDIVIFNEITSQIKVLTNLLKSSLKRNMAIISLTKTLDLLRLKEFMKDLNHEVIYQTCNYYERINTSGNTLHLDLIKFNKNIEDRLEKIIDRIQSIDTIVKEDGDNIDNILIISESRDLSCASYEYYKNNHQYYDVVKDILSYDNTSHLQIQNYKKKKDSNNILFIASDEIDDMFELLIMNPNIQYNVKCLFILDDNLKNDKTNYQKLITLLLSTNKQNSQLFFIEQMEDDLAKHLYRFGQMFYDNNKTNVQIFNEIVDEINLGLIYLDMTFNDIQHKRLEKTFKITEADKRFAIRHNIIYIVPIPKSSASTIRHNYQFEEEFIKSDLNTNELRGQYEMIVASKKIGRKIPIYIGPKWLSRRDRIEIEGNKIGFTHESTNTIEICEIIGIKEFSRRDKRKHWKEKDNKNRNILFLSPIIEKYQLSKFKTIMKLKKTDQIKYMQEFIFD